MIVVITVAKLRRGRDAVRSSAMLAPHRRALIEMVSGDDGDSKAKAVLRARASVRGKEHVWAVMTRQGFDDHTRVVTSVRR